MEYDCDFVVPLIHFMNSSTNEQVLVNRKQLHCNVLPSANELQLVSEKISNKKVIKNIETSLEDVHMNSIIHTSDEKNISIRGKIQINKYGIYILGGPCPPARFARQHLHYFLHLF